MGISGLLPLLRSIHKNTTLKQFAGQTLGIDGYGWLHRGAVACAIELALDKPTTKFVDFAMSRVRMLLDFGVTPYVIFDGDNLPSKSGTNEERRKRRDAAKTLGLSLYKAGKTAQAYQELQKATGVTPAMARLLIEELKKLNVQYIVAPYEADAQLAYLERKGIIDGILSEDSDLLVFGAKRLITKLNQYGECIEIQRTDFPLCKEISLAGFTDAMFRRMAILSGCDYLPNIDKMGLKTAHRFVRKYKEVERTIRMIAFEGKFCVPSDYLEKFNQAELTFLHHRVFCPIQQKMVFLTDLERGMSEDNMPYLGKYVEPDVVIGVACGDLNPKNKQPIEVKASTSTRPSLRENRRQTLGTPSDLKKSSSIDNFFKPHRTPLQELDPNSLTPSPSQQRLLERNRNASWEPRPVSSAPQLRRVATATAQNNTSAERRAFLARASTISSYQPTKRQRLCSENVDVVPSEEIQQSPFFASSVSALSPLAQKKTRNRKAKRDFDVWSDDSVDGILVGLVDAQQEMEVIKSTGETQAVESTDPSQDAAADLHAIPQSSPTQSSDESQGPQYSSNNTQAMLFPKEPHGLLEDTVVVNYDDDPEAFEDLLEYHVRMQNGKLARTFVAQSPSGRSTALQSISSPKKRVASPSGIDIYESPGSHVSRKVVPEASTSQQQIHHPASSTTSNILKTFLYQSLSVQKSALQSLGQVQSVQEKVQVGRAALAGPTNSQTPTKITNLNEERSDACKLSESHSVENLKGSEDTLVPDSEDEVSVGEEVESKPTFSLKSFVFTG